MALNFPNTGLYAGLQYTGDNGVTYIFDGVKWVGRAAATNSSTTAGDWTWYNNTVSTPANIDLQIQTVSTSSQRTYSYWISEYGGLGASANSDYLYGTGALYDSQGNLYVIGTAEISGDTNVNDSLMLKYDSLGNLMWHKTWHDSVNNNCGATNVAIAIDSTDRIYWIANNWSTSGCWFGYMDTEGNLGLGGTSQEVIGFSTVWPSDLACDDEHAYIAGSDYVNTYGGGTSLPFIAKVNGNTGALVWTKYLETVNVNGDPTSGTYRAVTVNPIGDVFAIGDYVDADGTRAMLSKWNSAGVQQWTRKLVTNVGDRGEAVVHHNGAIYTVVNDGGDNKVVVSRFDISGTLIWAANLAVGGPGPQGYDLSFDADHNIYLTGLLEGNLWLTKVNSETGVMLYSRSIATSQGSTILDGTGDPIVGHRVGDIFENRIAITAMTTSDIQQGGSFHPRIIVSQLPLAGNIIGTFSNVVIYDVTADISGICSTGTYSLSTLTWTAQSLGTGLVTSSQLSQSNVTVLGTMTNKTITLAAGPVVGIATTTSTWKFTSGGDLVLPAGSFIQAAENGPVTIRAGNEPTYWWSEYGDLLTDNADDWGAAVEYDSHGAVYIAGGTYYDGNGGEGNIRALLIKYSATGELLWQKMLSEQTTPYVRAEGLWIDSADNLYMIASNDDNSLSYLIRLDTVGPYHLFWCCWYSE